MIYDWTIPAVLFTAVLAGFVAFALYHIYSGIHSNLHRAKAGEVYNFEYLQPNHGEPERFLIKVLDVCTFNDDYIHNLNKRSYYRRTDPTFVRTKHLVTGQSPDGRIRNFYAERVVNCRRPLLGNALFKVGVAHLF